MKHGWLLFVLALVFGGVFVWAGVVKAISPMTFLDDIRTFDLLRDPYAAWLALYLPWLEILAGLAAALGVWRSGGLLVLNGLLLVFLGVITLSWWRGLDIRCGCFGESAGLSPYVELYLRDIPLLGLGLFLLFKFTRAQSADA